MVDVNEYMSFVECDEDWSEWMSDYDIMCGYGCLVFVEGGFLVEKDLEGYYRDVLEGKLKESRMLEMMEGGEG